MKSLEWAISLCRTDLDQCTEGDRLNITEALYDFIYWIVEAGKNAKGSDAGTGEKRAGRHNGYLSRTDIFPPASRDIFLRSLNVKDLAAVQKRFRKRFEMIATHPPTLVWAAGSAITIIRSSLSGPFERVVWPSMMNPKGHLLSATDHALIDHLVQSVITADQIRTCPQCGALFLARRKLRRDRKHYCPYGRCAVNAATRAYRARSAEKLKKKERTRNAERYEQKIQQKFPGTRIGRRPRTKKAEE